MAVFIDSTRVSEIEAQVAAAQAQMDLKEAEIAANMGNPVIWTDEERSELMAIATLLAFLSENDLACYPLSVSSVLFVTP